MTMAPMSSRGGLIRKEACPFYKTSFGVRLCGSSKNLQDLKDPTLGPRTSCPEPELEAGTAAHVGGGGRRAAAAF